MRPTLSHTGTGRRTALIMALTLLGVSSACSGSTEPDAWATLTLVSGDNQTVTIDPVGLTPIQQPVLVHLDSLGMPIADGELRVAIHMNGMPGPNGPYAFTTGSDGTASMQLVVSNIPGPVRIEVSYVRCMRPGIFYGCDQERTFATLSLHAVAVR